MFIMPRFFMEILQNFIAREREQMSWKQREVSAMMTATTRRYLLLRHLSSSYAGGKGGGAHARIGRGFWRRQYHHQCASFTRSAFPVVSREGFAFWRGFAARSSTNTTRDGGRNQAFSGASSVLSSNRSASSSSGGETDDDSDDEVAPLIVPQTPSFRRASSTDYRQGTQESRTKLVPADAARS